MARGRLQAAARREEAVALIPFAAPGVPGIIVAVGRATDRWIDRQHPALPFRPLVDARLDALHAIPERDGLGRGWPSTTTPSPR